VATISQFPQARRKVFASRGDTYLAISLRVSSGMLVNVDVVIVEIVISHKVVYVLGLWRAR